MAILKTKVGRRSFIKTSALAGGGLMISFSWLASCTPGQSVEEVLAMPDEWFELNSYLKIGDNGRVTIRVPNPEFGQNVKTSMPMIVAEELDTNWKYVVSEQAPYDKTKYDRQFTGGSQGIRRAWASLRMAGGTARQMLKQAAANEWHVAIDEIRTEDGQLIHEASGKKASYGAFASAAALLPQPEQVELKDVKNFSIIGQSKKNVDGKAIVTGQQKYGIDIKSEDMLYAAIVHPPAFGQKLKGFDADSVRSMSGIVDVFAFETYSEGYEQNFFDTHTHNKLIAIVGKSTWEVFQAKKEIRVEWEPFNEFSFDMDMFGNKTTVNVPSGLESTSDHLAKFKSHLGRPGTLLRKDGDPDKAFAEADKVIEKTYTAPFLAHNMMEPINCFAHVTPEKALVRGPIQAPEFIEGTIAARLGLPLEKVEIEMSRMGGGFGRRAYGHYMVEAAVISKRVGKPIKMTYSREDDMTYGIYRPAYCATYRAALDADNNLIAFHVKAGGIPESPLGRGAANRFPAGAVDHYLAEEWSEPSNITVGAFRAPRSNFHASAEQSFLDELAELAGKDPIDFRLELLQRAKINPVGENNDYDADRYAGVLELVREKSNWDTAKPGLSRGVSAYFCHNSYAAHVLDLKMENGKPRVENVTCVMDCGVVVNPDAAANMAEGAIVDGIGNAFYGVMTFREGQADKENFGPYRMIRHSEAPKNIAVHFVQNEIDPTGMGEPPFPPIFGAVANALYQATNRRYYNQPFLGKGFELG
ncbi:isoquinoline 1-oxidoreductase, beta subunit [Reichenbachiella agariperforans]|uniref:Isoquinoline 1-oxidoreductase, beta subunit n=1 Tax=Reichenbachiella agariperforans TaxID=156994 RepID=A0A1M6PWX7_REIAG|nr:molybdopterin cofactor-binding domain-containing protein [Reichenbachiella agariperforans]SHK12386.1 isoquinoline 1-oxidoreductase, beta subunit [Reichenbachiella agariperforans]